MFKVAGIHDHEKAARLLEDIRSENPSHWPHGLTVGHFRPGNLWLLHKSASGEPVGFVGWQSYQEGPEKVGCYSIGILPSYRGIGLAKAAVTRMLREKSASVDRVVAHIVPGNSPSERLASNLGVEVIKQASFLTAMRTLGEKPLMQFLGKSPVMHGLYGATAMDAYNWPTRGIVGENSDWSGTRIPNTLINAVLTGGGSKLIQYGNKANSPALIGLGATGIFSAPAKDMALSAVPAFHAMAEAGHKYTNTPEAAPAAGTEVKVDAGGKSNLLPALLLGGLGVGGLAMLGKALKRDEDHGRMKVTLPTKNPNDVETTLDLPLGRAQITTPALRQKLDRDARRRLYAEVNARTYRKGRKSEEDLTAVTA